LRKGDRKQGWHKSFKERLIRQQHEHVEFFRTIVFCSDISRNLIDYTTVMGFLCVWKYFTKGVLNFQLDCLQGVESAVPLTHCGDEDSVQIAEQLTVQCDLLELCPGRFIRWGLSCNVMNCLPLCCPDGLRPKMKSHRPSGSSHTVIWSTPISRFKEKLTHKVFNAFFVCFLELILACTFLF